MSRFGDPALDAIQAWEEEAFARREGFGLPRRSGGDAEPLVVGPFRVALAWGYAFPFRESPPAETRRAIDELRALLRERGRRARWEFNERCWPGLAAAFEDAGLALDSRNPLMVVDREDFRPFAAPDVELQTLDAAAGEADLRAFQSIRWSDTHLLDEQLTPRALARLRDGLERPTARFLLARVDGVAAGTGVSHAVRGVAEIVGVVTLSRFRRRGVASAVTSALVVRHFAEGGAMAFLDAANSGAESVYARLGFRGVGDRLTYGDRG